MEELQKKHRQQQKDLQSRITQKKKIASKKTRKGINDECAVLERELKERQDEEIAVVTGIVSSDITDTEISKSPGFEDNTIESPREITNPPLSVTPTNGQAKKPNRQKARLARRAAGLHAAAEEAREEIANLPNMRDKERQSMKEAFTAKGLYEYEIRSDGHCLYAAVADQLQNSKIDLKPRIEFAMPEPGSDQKPSPGYKLTRQVAAAYISQNSEDFIPFLEEPLDKYLRTINETGEWGGHLEILALAKAYGVDINVLQGDHSVQKIECGLQQDHPELWLAYYHHSFGLGEHYNSLRQAG